MDKQLILYYGGTFDPFHNGHVYVINSVLEIMKKDYFKLVISPILHVNHKEKREMFCFDKRFNSLKEFFKNQSYTNKVDVIDWRLYDVDSSRTFDSINFLKKFIYNDYNVYFMIICGSDCLNEISLWKDYKNLLSENALLSIPRCEKSISSTKINEERLYNSSMIPLECLRYYLGD